MDLLRYLIVFFTVLWGGGLLILVPLLAVTPFLSFLRRRGIDRVLLIGANCLAMFLAVLIANAACRWTGGEPTYLMFLIAFCGMLFSDVRRIKRAQSGESRAGKEIAHDPQALQGYIVTESWNTMGDIVGFAVGLVSLSPLTFL